MSKYIAGSSNKRLWGEDINEDYFIHNSKMAVVCDGMGGGGINVPRSHLENILIELYPNPSKSIVNIKFNKILNNSTLEVYNSLGKLCIKQSIKL